MQRKTILKVAAVTVALMGLFACVKCPALPTPTEYCAKFGQDPPAQGCSYYEDSNGCETISCDCTPVIIMPGDFPETFPSPN